MNKKSAIWIGIVVAVVLLGWVLTRRAGQPTVAEVPEPEAVEAAAPEADDSVAGADEAAQFHIGIVTGTVSQSEDDLRGAEEMIRLYGDATTGGMIRHLTYPDNFMTEMETTIAQIAGMADDPLMKVIVVNQAIPGTAEGFRRVKEIRSDIICLAGEAHEDPNVIGSVADLTVNADFVSRGYLIPHSARELGAKTFVHISFPRHMSYESLGRRRAIMEKACEELGIKFVFETAPDPTSDVGVAGAQQFILEKVPAWVEQYGKDTAFFCTNDAHTEPLLRQLAANGGFFVEADIPSPLMGYPGAFGIDLQNESGDWPAILKKVEDAVVEAGAGGRMGTWAYSLGFCHTAGLAEFGRLIAEGSATIDDTDKLLASYGKFSPGANWNGNYYVDAATGTELDSYFLVYQDTYILGKGYLGVADVEVPEQFLSIQMTDITD
ncbi:MAG: DUF3798 domain-containing protein [Synergistaceae bacterium]|jgi:hypothetical protein|nr:DUF3798 domain-containing protein [Synergistaceae bacterium]